MKVFETHSEPEHAKDRQPYRLRIEGRDGQAIEVVEQMGGGFRIAAVSRFDSMIEIVPLGMHAILVRDQQRR